jgi:hypothetical protein
MDTETSSGNDYLTSLVVWMVILIAAGVMMFTVCDVIDITKSIEKHETVQQKRPDSQLRG